MLLDGVEQVPVLVHSHQLSCHLYWNQTRVEHFCPHSAENCSLKLVLSAQTEA